MFVLKRCWWTRCLRVFQEVSPSPVFFYYGSSMGASFHFVDLLLRGGIFRASLNEVFFNPCFLKWWPDFNQNLVAKWWVVKALRAWVVFLSSQSAGAIIGGMHASMFYEPVFHMFVLELLTATWLIPKFVFQYLLFVQRLGWKSCVFHLWMLIKFQEILIRKLVD